MNIRHKQTLQRKYQQQPGYKSRVIAKCIECIVDHTASGTWRQQIESCSARHCPLYDVRPRVTTQSAAH